jgi:general secretion pathway protein K
MYSRSHHLSIKHSRGIVLPSVLWITILSIVIAVNYASAVQLNTRTADNIKTSTLARYDAISGIYLALDRLLSNPASANQTFRLELNGNTVDVEVRPESRKISLNEVSIDKIRGTFIEAGADPEFARTLAARVIDWRDGDKSTQAYGMEDAGYYDSGKPYGAKDSRIEDLVELLLMADIDPQLFKTLADHVTVYSSRIPRLYTLTSRAHDVHGKPTYVTRAIVRVTYQRSRPYRILKWQHHNG